MLGLIIWLTLGCATALAHTRLPGTRPRWWSALLVGAGFALAGGLLATALGVGGIAVFDARSAVVAVLAAIVGLNLQRLALVRRGDQG